MATDTTPVRNDALSRASALANRARELRRAQAEVQEMTAREVQVLARTAASFFDAIPLVEFTPTLLPQSAKGLRRIRHRILHRTIHNTAMGTMIRALLLGRDGNLRLFSARSADSRDLLLIMEPGRTLPTGVMRDVVDWSPLLRVPGFRPFEILDRLSTSLDAVEEQIADAETRVQVQKAALTSGDLSALLPGGGETGTSVAAQESRVEVIAATSAPRAIASGLERIESPLPEPRAAVAAAAPVSVFEMTATTPDTPAAPRGPASSGTPTAVATPAIPAQRDPFDMFDLVEAVAAAVEPPHPSAPVAAARDPRFDLDAEPEEWDEPVEAPPPPPASPSLLRALFPAMPAPR